MQNLLVRSIALIVILIIATVSSESASVWNYRTDKAYGTNLGGWLVLERWIQPILFESNAPNAIDEWTFCEQAVNATEALNNHWTTFILEEHIKMFADVNGNHIRVPVGYWAFITPAADEPFVSSGQKRHLERILGYFDKYNIHAIIDLHGMPGSQNGEHHSGHTTEVQFYTDFNMERSIRTIQAVVDWMNNLPANLKSRIAAIQPVNEPDIGNASDLERLKRFYLDAYEVINASPYKVAMVFGDGFQGLEAFSDFLPSTANAVIDLHRYHAFPPQNDTDEIIARSCVNQHLGEHFHLPVFFGEWSLASAVPNDADWFKKMMDTQVYAYKNGGCGFAFWTLRNNAATSPGCYNYPTETLSRQTPSYNCFDGMSWSMEKLIITGVVNSRTFSNTINQQCQVSSCELCRSNTFLLVVCLIAFINMLS